MENGYYLEHHGILGQKWGIRRYQNEDGSHTQAGKRHREDIDKSGRRSTVKKIAKGVGIALGVAAVAYGAYKLSQLPVVRNKSIIDSLISDNATVSSSVKDKSTKEAQNLVESILNGTGNAPNKPKVNISNRPKVSRPSSAKPPEGFTFRRHFRVDASGKTSHIDLPTDPKRYADDFAKKMSNGNQKDYDYWHEYITNRMKYQ